MKARVEICLQSCIRLVAFIPRGREDENVRKNNKDYSKLSYYVDNVQEYKNTLLAEAVKDSKKKAEILVATLDKKLGEVINIDYSWGEVNIVRNREMPIAVPEFLKKGSARTPNITPNDIEISDTVTVLWQII